MRFSLSPRYSLFATLQCNSCNGFLNKRNKQTMHLKLIENVTIHRAQAIVALFQMYTGVHVETPLHIVPHITMHDQKYLAKTNEQSNTTTHIGAPSYPLDVKLPFLCLSLRALKNKRKKELNELNQCIDTKLCTVGIEAILQKAKQVVFLIELKNKCRIK